MKRQGFLLGLFSIGGQVLLLRELVSSLNGDELFIGTALFGWLVSVAIGAYLGGKSGRPRNPNRLFIIGVIMLPVMIAVVKMSPLAVTSVTGEVVPFSKAVIISILTMLPIGIISGWLFPLVTRRVIYPASDAVAVVYLYEGIGAFVGGIIIFILVFGNIPTFAMTGMISSLVIGGVLAIGGILRRTVVCAGSLILVLLCLHYLWIGDWYLEAAKYESFEVVGNRYTPYGHSLFLERDDSINLLRDNTVEVVYPDVETAENHFLAPIIYAPPSGSILYAGLGSFISASLDSGAIPGPITVVDPRRTLGRPIEDIVKNYGGTWQSRMKDRDTDPVS